MKETFVRLARVLTTLTLCLALLCPLPVSAADVCFTAINDSLEYLQTDTMPLWSGGVLYVPYTLFEPTANSTGVSLGLSAIYNRNTSFVSLYSGKKFLDFDLNTGTSRDGITGARCPGKALLRNGKPYVPLKLVCDFFGLRNSYTKIPQGYLVRVKNDAVVLDDAMFIDAAGNLLNRRLREYNQSIAPTPETPPPPTIPTPPPSVTPPPSPTDVHTYLAFRCNDTAGVPAILDGLARRGDYALFLFPPRVLNESGDLIRRILGTGHSVGLLADGTTPEETRALLDEGGRLLKQLFHLRTTVAHVPADQRPAFEAEGWICWNETLSLAPGTRSGANSFAANALRRLNKRTLPTYLTLTGDVHTGRVLPTLLQQLEDKHFIVNIPMETRL